MVDENDNENGSGANIEKRESQRLSKAAVPPPPPPPPPSPQAKTPKEDARKGLMQDIQNMRPEALKKVGAQQAPVAGKPADGLMGIFEKRIPARKSTRLTKTYDDTTLDGFFKKNRDQFLSQLRPLDPEARKVALKDIKAQWEKVNKNDEGWDEDDDVDSRLNDLTRILAIEDDNKLKALQAEKAQEKRKSAEKDAKEQVAQNSNEVVSSATKKPASPRSSVDTNVVKEPQNRAGLNNQIQEGFKLRPVGSVSGKKRKISSDEIQKGAVELAMEERRKALYNPQDEEDSMLSMSFNVTFEEPARKAVPTSASKRRSVMVAPAKSTAKLTSVVGLVKQNTAENRKSMAPPTAASSEHVDVAARSAVRMSTIPAPDAQLPAPSSVIPKPAEAILVGTPPSQERPAASVARYSMEANKPKPEAPVAEDAKLRGMKDSLIAVLSKDKDNFAGDYKREHAKKRKWAFKRNKDNDIKEIKQYLDDFIKAIDKVPNESQLAAVLKLLDEFIETKMKRFNPEKRSSVGTVLQRLKNDLQSTKPGLGK